MWPGPWPVQSGSNWRHKVKRQPLNPISCGICWWLNTLGGSCWGWLGVPPNYPKIDHFKYCKPPTLRKPLCFNSTSEFMWETLGRNKQLPWLGMIFTMGMVYGHIYVSQGWPIGDTSHGGHDARLTGPHKLLLADLEMLLRSKSWLGQHVTGTFPKPWKTPFGITQ